MCCLSNETKPKCCCRRQSMSTEIHRGHGTKFKAYKSPLSVCREYPRPGRGSLWKNVVEKIGSRLGGRRTGGRASEPTDTGGGVECVSNSSVARNRISTTYRGQPAVYICSHAENRKTIMYFFGNERKRKNKKKRESARMSGAGWWTENPREKWKKNKIKTPVAWEISIGGEARRNPAECCRRCGCCKWR